VFTPSSKARPIRKATRRFPCEPRLEILESRLAPATHIWNGPLSGGFWSNAANWNGGLPTTGEAGGTIVQFNGGVQSTDDIAGLVVNQIHFTAGNNTIKGTTSLGINGSGLSTNLQNDASYNYLDASLPLTTSGSFLGATITGGPLYIDGNISGTKGIEQYQASTGKLVLGGTVSYSGFTAVNGGTLSLTGNSPGYSNTTSGGAGTLIVNGDYSGSPCQLTSATLEGRGTVQSIDTSLGAGNKISPGGFGSTGTLTTAPGAFASKLMGTSFQVDVDNPTVFNPTGSDQLVIGNSATVDLTGATLSLNVLNSTGENVYTIVSSASGGISGTFTGLADNTTFQLSGRTLRIHYTPTAVTLTDLTGIDTWIGPASGGLWSNAANWDHGAPATGATGGTIVKFSGGIDSTDDIAGLVVDRIHFASGGNTVRGTGALGITGQNMSENIQSDAGTNSLDASLQLTVASAAGFGINVNAGQLNVSSNIIGGTSSVFVEKTSVGNVILAGSNNFAAVSGGASAISVGGGVLSLTGASPNCKGGTQAYNGTVVVNADYSNSPLYLLSNGTLAGTGTVEKIVTDFGLGNVVSPGGAGSIGTLTTAAGAFASQLADSTFQVDVAGPTASDQIAIGNGATIDLTGATLSINVLGSAPGSVSTIVSSPSGGISGTFKGLADGATLQAGGRTFRVNYTPQAVTLTDRTGTPDQLYVAAVYLDLLKRPVDIGGLNYWAGRLDKGEPRSIIAGQLSRSAEYYQTNIIRPAYQQFLGRAADQAGLDFWTTQLQGGLTDEQMQAGFIASQEFYNNANGGPVPVTPAHDRAWVDALYMALLNRTPDKAGEDYWTAQLQGLETRTQVANGFTASQEGIGLRIDQTYLRYLGRHADPNGLAYWLLRYQTGATDEDIVTGFIGSNEFFNQATM
jgi:hypothetical protein